MVDIFLTENDDSFPSTSSPHSDTIYGLAGNDLIYAGNGADIVYGGDGNDRIYDGVEPTGWSYEGDIRADTLHGGSGDDRLRGTILDSLYGDAGNDDLIDGGIMVGGEGDDYYSLASAQSQVFELVGEGYDSVLTSIDMQSYVLPDNVEEVTFLGATVDSLCIGNDIDNIMTIYWDNTARLEVLFYGTLEGLGGNDTLYGASYYHRLYGGEGNDILYITDYKPQVIDGGGGVDTVIFTSRRTRTIDLMQSPFSGVENARSEATSVMFADFMTISGTDDANILSSLHSRVKLYGRDGDDTLLYYGHVSTSRFEGGDGYDTIDCSVAGAGVALDMTTGTYIGVTSVERVIGSAFGDTITGNIEANRIEGREGNDSISGANGDDALYGNDGDDTLHGDAGNDTLGGGAGVNAVYGDAGNDTLIANLGVDTLHGGTGNDRFRISVAGTTIVELADEGVDQVFTSVDFTLSDNLERMTSLGSGLTLVGNDLANILFGDAGANAILGGSGNDNIRGAAGDDTVRGEGGNDAVIGDDGNDNVFGGSGNDVLTGGQGIDQLTGGIGRDSFRFDLVSDTAGVRTQADRILDFNQTDGDRIALSGIDAHANFAGNQAFAFIGNAAFTSAGAELRAVRLDGNTYVIGDLNGDSIGDFYIRLDGLYTLTAADFVL